MKIEITLDHTDLIGTSAEHFGALMYMLQGLAKSNRLFGGMKPFTEPVPNFPEQKTASDLSPAEEVLANAMADIIKNSSPKESVKAELVTKEEPEKNSELDRKAIISEIKTIAASGNNKSSQVRAFMSERYNKIKLNTLTDEELVEVREMVKTL